MAIKRKSKINPNFNMSSMTDIFFLLLLFFMISSTLINPNALKLLLPKRELEDPCISLQADKSVPLEQIVKVMNIAKDHNYRLILSTEPE